MKNNWEGLTEEFPRFMDKIFKYLVGLGLNVEGLTLDHAAIRFADPRDVDNLRKELDALSVGGAPISNEIVNGRPILIYKLLVPLVYQSFEVCCIELPYPAEDHDHKDGWEHVEFVIPSEAASKEEFESGFYERFPNFDKTNPLVKEYAVKMPVVEEQIPNPTVSIKGGDNTTVKFHPKAIEEVVMK